MLLRSHYIHDHTKQWIDCPQTYHQSTEQYHTYFTLHDLPAIRRGGEMRATRHSVRRTGPCTSTNEPRLRRASRSDGQELFRSCQLSTTPTTLLSTTPTPLLFQPSLPRRFREPIYPDEPHVFAAFDTLITLRWPAPFCRMLEELRMASHPLLVPPPRSIRKSL